ncbi:MAG: hypothetical protein R2710_26485 [Acidimicrobiales bacterium]
MVVTHPTAAAVAARRGVTAAISATVSRVSPNDGSIHASEVVTATGDNSDTAPRTTVATACTVAARTSTRRSPLLGVANSIS